MYNMTPISGYPTFGQTRDCCIRAFDYNGLLELSRQNSIVHLVNAGIANNSIVLNNINRMKAVQHSKQIASHQAKLLNSIIPRRPIMGI